MKEVAQAFLLWAVAKSRTKHQFFGMLENTGGLFWNFSPIIHRLDRWNEIPLFLESLLNNGISFHLSTGAGFLPSTGTLKGDLEGCPKKYESTGRLFKTFFIPLP